MGLTPVQSGQSPRQARGLGWNCGSWRREGCAIACPGPRCCRCGQECVRPGRGRRAAGGAGRLARAYSLAGLAVEEVGKAGSLAALAALPEHMRARAPVGRLLAWHQLKLVKGM